MKWKKVKWRIVILVLGLLVVGFIVVNFMMKDVGDYHREGIEWAKEVVKSNEVIQCKVDSCMLGGNVIK